jgi:murein endopeptidase
LNGGQSIRGRSVAQSHYGVEIKPVLVATIHRLLARNASGSPSRPSDGCGHELDFWFKASTLHPPLHKPNPALTLAGLPAACKQIVKAP